MPMLAIYRRYEKWWPVLFFLAGFAYDIWSLGRIDSLFSIVKQGLYLFVIALLLGLEILDSHGEFKPSGKLASAWRYHELVIHFLLGSLLSEYTLFFFKSASLWNSFFFITVLGLVLLMNEFKQFEGASGIPVRSTLFSLCLVGYFVYLVPLLIGHVGTIPFLLSIALTAAFGWLPILLVRRRLPAHTEKIKKQSAYPLFGVLAAFVVLYFLHLIPPAPIAIQYIGIFHELKKESGNYILGYDARGARFWQNGERDFLARAGDRPYCFVRIFSPSRFNDQIQVRWLFKDPSKGWQSADAIPMSIAGGRDEGYRGFTFKSNYQPGDWQVRIETSDGREVGRVYFTIAADLSDEPRAFDLAVQ